jgi:hypothetical protein
MQKNKIIISNATEKEDLSLAYKLLKEYQEKRDKVNVDICKKNIKNLINKN